MVQDVEEQVSRLALGTEAQVLLVRRCEKIIALVLAALQLAIANPPSAAAGVVRAADYRSFWVWGGVESQPVLSQAQALYILQGEVVEKGVGAGSNAAVIPQGAAVGRISRSDVWLVFRATTLQWTPEIVRTILARLEWWKLSGNPVVGLQVDFDARTKHLPEYVRFLRKLRNEVPSQYRLSITGLLDWPGNGDVEAINGLKDVVDEVVVQTYQGRRTISNYRAYLPALKRLAVPFKIGLIQHGEWEAPVDLASNPCFIGYVVFLQNPHRRNSCKTPVSPASVPSECSEEK